MRIYIYDMCIFKNIISLSQKLTVSIIGNLYYSRRIVCGLILSHKVASVYSRFHIDRPSKEKHRHRRNPKFNIRVIAVMRHISRACKVVQTRPHVSSWPQIFVGIFKDVLIVAEKMTHRTIFNGPNNKSRAKCEWLCHNAITRTLNFGFRLCVCFSFDGLSIWKRL